MRYELFPNYVPPVTLYL